MKLRGLAGVSGIPEVEREVHDFLPPLLARISCRLGEGSYIIALVDDPFTVAAIEDGEIVDCVCSTDSGAFSLRTSGELPTGDLLRASLDDPISWRKRLLMEGGIYSYLSTDDLGEALKRDPLLVEAMAYQMAKEIWAMATVFCGNFDAIVLSGGLLSNEIFKSMLTKRLEPLSKKIIVLEVV